MSIDSQISEALKQAYPQQPFDSQSVLASVLGKATGGAAGAGAGTAASWSVPYLGWIIAGAVAAGVAVGTWWGWSDPPPVPDPIPGAVMGDTTVPLWACPDDAMAGLLAASGQAVGGDHVWITARSEDGTWLEVRDMRRGAQPAFVAAAYVQLDDGIDHLPVSDCELRGDLTPLYAAPETLPEPDPEPPVAQPQQPAQPGQTTPPAPPPPPPPDTQAPSIGQVQRSQLLITEQNSTVPFVITCAPPRPLTSIVSAVITDNVGVTQATIKYTVPGASQVTRTMTKSGNTWSATVGPVPGYTVPANSTQSVTVTIEAKDAAGNTATTTTTVSVESIEKCFG